MCSQEYLTLKKGLSNNIAELAILASERENKIEEIRLNIIENIAKLKAQISDWENKYVIKAAFSGTIEYLDFLNDNDFVNAGKELIEIMPFSDNFIANIYLSNINSGKLRKGQLVRIKLEDFPYTEYGLLEGSVADFSSTQIIDKQNKVQSLLVNVNFSKILKTDQGYLLPKKNRMKGAAEIITFDRNLFEKIFEKIQMKIS
ncbi:MAG: HlyD family efflux transporter periplasmic adaptor subunit [Sediminibacterium sp.]